jgi:hypothetical protein
MEVDEKDLLAWSKPLFRRGGPKEKFRRDGRANVPVEKVLIVKGLLVLLVVTFAGRGGCCGNAPMAAFSPARRGRDCGLGIVLLRAAMVTPSRHSGSLSLSCLVANCCVSLDAILVRSSRRRRSVWRRDESDTEGQISEARTAMLFEGSAGVR